MNTEKKFKFSIVIAVLEKKDFWNKAIPSLLSQTLDFSKNIELILVGSVEENKQIFAKYLSKYSQNIKLVEASSFSASYFNSSLNYCTGKYINFMNPNSMFSKNTLEEVYTFFEQNNEDIDMVSIPFFLYKDKLTIHDRCKNLATNNCIIDLEKEPSSFVNLSSTFYKKEKLKCIDINEKLSTNQDNDLIFKMYMLNRKYGYVSNNNVKTIILKTDNVTEKIETYFDLCNVIDDIVKNGIYDYQKEYILYELIHKLKKITRDMFMDDNDYEYIIKKFRDYLLLVDDDFIIGKTKIITNLDLKYFLLKFKKSQFAFQIDDSWNILCNNIEISKLEDINVKIKRFDSDNEYIYIDMMINDYNIADLGIIIKSNNEIYKPYYDQKIKSSYDLKHGEFDYKKIRTVKFKLPISENTFNIKYINQKTDAEINLINTTMLSFIKYTLKDKNVKIFKNGYSLSYNGNEIVVTKEKQKIFSYKIKTFIYFVMNYKYFAFARLFNRKKKKYILLNDRPEKAGDNGEALFKYINKEEPLVAKNTYFVLAKKDKEYKRMKKYGKVIIQNSLRHKYMFLNSKLIASSHACKDFYIPFKIQQLKYYVDLLDYKFIWLQHGIIHNNVARSINQYNANIDYFVVSGFKEKEEVLLDRYFYDMNRVILTGMPRYDYLESSSSNIISLLPTWRRSLSGRIMKSGFHETKTGFEESQYYMQYSALLNSEELNKLLEKNNFVLQFILHPGMAGYEEYFYKFKNDRINIISASNVDYNKVFKESNLLITDYSSVAFDFSYLKKPLIYFQFDRDLFFSNHYEPGYFDYIKDGFGEVIEKSENIIKKIEHYFSSAFQVEENYLNNIDKIFAHNDKNNSKRIIDVLRDENIL